VDDLALAGGGPDVLEVAIALGQAVEGVIALAAGTDEAAKSVGLVLAGVAAVLVNLADGELDGGVVVGLDDAVGGAALAGHVAEREVMLVVLVLLEGLRANMFPSNTLLCPGFSGGSPTIAITQRRRIFSILAISDHTGFIFLAWDQGGIADCMRPHRHWAQGILGLEERV
jgi:hypothetical protein